MEQKYILIKINHCRLQEFFCVLSLFELYEKRAVFISNKKNEIILKECNNFVKTNILDIKKCSESIDTEVISIEINHETPFTKINNLYQAPVIFPKILSKNFYKPLIEKKTNKIYFRGLFTYSRAFESLLIFIFHLDLIAIFKIFSSILSKKKNFEINTNKIKFVFTNRGRVSKYKFLDEEYYKEMSNYRFIFCPKGDFIWTYRFFESIQLGSIPITCFKTKIYDDFKYFKIYDDLRKINQNVINKNLKIFKSTYNIN
jgi:hypothetical protein